MRRYFDALDTSESVEEGGMGSEREAVEGDLKELTLEELHDKIRETKSLLERFYDIAEDGRNWLQRASSLTPETGPSRPWNESRRLWSPRHR